MEVKFYAKLQDTAVPATATSNLVVHGVGSCYVTLMGKKLLKNKTNLNLEQYQKLLK
jgi:hypothetical protein